MQKTIFLMISVLMASVLVASTYALVTIEKNIPASGSIKGVGLGVFWDSQCSNATSSISFGTLEAGSNKDFTLYLRNEGNTPVTLTMTAENWNPIQATNYMSLSWNREGLQISPNQVISCVITLSVSSNIQNIDSFNLGIIISGTG